MLASFYGLPVFFSTDPPTPGISTLSLHDALPIFPELRELRGAEDQERDDPDHDQLLEPDVEHRSEEHTSELQSRGHLVCRLLLEKKKKKHFYEHQSLTMRESARPGRRAWLYGVTS